jgi:hypothetical protein
MNKAEGRGRRRRRKEDEAPEDRFKVLDEGPEEPSHHDRSAGGYIGTRAGSRGALR